MFQLLKDKYSDVVDLNGWDFQYPVSLYSDASGYGASCLIMQLRDGDRGQEEVLILFDSFTFSEPQRNYGVYKKELLANTATVVYVFSNRSDSQLN